MRNIAYLYRDSSLNYGGLGWRWCWWLAMVKLFTLISLYELSSYLYSSFIEYCPFQHGQTILFLLLWFIYFTQNGFTFPQSSRVTGFFFFFVLLFSSLSFLFSFVFPIYEHELKWWRICKPQNTLDWHFPLICYRSRYSTS